MGFQPSPLSSGLSGHLFHLPLKVLAGPAIANRLSSHQALVPGPEDSSVVRVIGGKVLRHDVTVEVIKWVHIAGAGKLAIQ